MSLCTGTAVRIAFPLFLKAHPVLCRNGDGSNCGAAVPEDPDTLLRGPARGGLCRQVENPLGIGIPQHQHRRKKNRHGFPDAGRRLNQQGFLFLHGFPRGDDQFTLAGAVGKGKRHALQGLIPLLAVPHGKFCPGTVFFQKAVQLLLQFLRRVFSLKASDLFIRLPAVGHLNLHPVQMVLRTVDGAIADRLCQVDRHGLRQLIRIREDGLDLIDHHPVRILFNAVGPALEEKRKCGIRERLAKRHLRPVVLPHGFLNTAVQARPFQHGILRRTGKPGVDIPAPENKFDQMPHRNPDRLFFIDLCSRHTLSSSLPGKCRIRKGQVNGAPSPHLQNRNLYPSPCRFLPAWIRGSVLKVSGFAKAPGQEFPPRSLCRTLPV